MSLRTRFWIGTVLIIALFCAGCSGVHHDTKPITDRNADRIECEEKVRAINAGASAPSRAQDEIRLVNECMRQKGWK